MRGSLLIIFAYSIINLTAGLGLFISNISNTQQQVLFTIFFVIIFILMNGLFTPIESMPKWVQYLTVPNPIAQFVSVMRKGSGFGDVAYNLRVTILFNGLAVGSYKKVS